MWLEREKWSIKNPVWHFLKLTVFILKKWERANLLITPLNMYQREQEIQSNPACYYNPNERPLFHLRRGNMLICKERKLVDLIWDHYTESYKQLPKGPKYKQYSFFHQYRKKLNVMRLGISDDQDRIIVVQFWQSN